jgi:hypothetical protein
MARGVIPKEGVAGLFGPFTDASQLRSFLSSVDPQSVTGSVLAPGDTWYHVPTAVGGFERPFGLGYVRYEDLFRTGDTVSQAMARLSASSPNALSDGSAYITFPEGQFVSRDFKAAGSTTYSIYVPKNCKGIIGSGPGTVGGSTGTVFTIAPNTWTAPFAPLQSGGQPNPFQIMYRGTGNVSNSTPILFAQFQVAGTTQGDVDGRCYHGFTVNNPEGPVTFQDLLTCGWFGISGAPPGETFGLAIGGNNGPHKMIRCEADGRRIIGGRGYGPVGLDCADAYGPELHECYSHHGVDSPMVFYQVKNGKTFNCVFGPQDYANRNGGNQGPNHERTDGTVHTNITVHPSTTNALVHMTHSNPNLTFTTDGHTWSTNDGKLTIKGLTYDAIYSDGKFYIQSWDPYDAGNGGESNATAPLVTLADGTTHIPYKWISHNVHIDVT